MQDPTGALSGAGFRDPTGRDDNVCIAERCRMISPKVTTPAGELVVTSVLSAPELVGSSRRSDEL
jgi:hypothetical protein